MTFFGRSKATGRRAAGLMLTVLALAGCGGAGASPSGSAAAAAASVAAKPSTTASAAAAAKTSDSAPAAASAKPAASASAAGSAQPAASVSYTPPAFNPYLAKPGEAPVNLKAAWCAISAGFVQWYVARDYGLFAKYGLNVQMSGFTSGSKEALAALQSGGLDFMYCAAASTIPGMASGVDATLIAAPLVGLPYVMVARKDIHSIQDLKGKKIGINLAGDIDDQLSHLVMKAANLPPDSAQYVPAGGQTQRYQAVLSGIIDAVNVTPPLDVQAKNDGLNLIYELKNLNIPFIYSAVHTSPKLIKEHPETVQRFVAAMAEAVWFIDGHKDATEQSIAKQLNIPDKASLDSAYNAYAEDYVNRSVDVPLKAVQDSIEYYRAQGTDIKRGKADQLVDSRFANDLQTSGFLEKMWGRRIPASN